MKLLPFLMVGILVSGCYTQLQVSEPQQRDRDTQRSYDRGYDSYDSQSAYDLGYDDGWFDAGIYYRDHRRAKLSRRHSFGYGYSPHFRHSFSFGFSYGYGRYHDPFYHRGGFWYHDPFYSPHRYAWGHRYSPYHRPSFISYNYYYFYNQPASVTRATRTSVSSRSGAVASRSVDSRTSNRSAVGNNMRSRVEVAERQREADLNRRSASDLRGVSSTRRDATARSSGNVDRRGSSANVRSRGTVGRSSSGNVRSRGSSRSSGEARSRGSSRSSGEARSRGSSRSSSSGSARSRSSSSSSSGATRSRSRGSSSGSSSSSRNRDRGSDDQAMLFNQYEQIPAIQVNMDNNDVPRLTLV